MFVAVVANQNPHDTGRTDGSLSCFLADTKEEAVTKAIKAKEQWEKQIHDHDHSFARVGSFYGPYRVLVAEVKEEAKVPVKYDLVEFKEAQ